MKKLTEKKLELTKETLKNLQAKDLEPWPEAYSAGRTPAARPFSGAPRHRRRPEASNALGAWPDHIEAIIPK